MANTYAYAYGDNLYINLTNKCPNDCEFCIRREGEGIGGHKLWLEHEPTAPQVIEQMGDLTPYHEVVFCGFGEPMVRLRTLLQVAAYAKAQGKATRINTNGLANLIHDEDVTPQLEGLIDTVSISLNASDAKAYDAVCHSAYGLRAFPALLAFAKCVQKHVPHVMFTVVDTIGQQEIERAQALADECGVQLRVRAWIEPERA